MPNVVFTGAAVINGERIVRDELIAMVNRGSTSRRWHVQDKVDYTTEYLVASRTDTTKACKARDLGVRVVTYDQFATMFMGVPSRDMGVTAAQAREQAENVPGTRFRIAPVVHRTDGRWEILGQTGTYATKRGAIREAQLMSHNEEVARNAAPKPAKIAPGAVPGKRKIKL